MKILFGNDYGSTLFIMMSILGLFSISGCYTPVESQEYFVQATAQDRAIKPIYSTPLYTVYFDAALKRCVVHSTHTWGQSGGGGGGTGIGVQVFRCDPGIITNRALELGVKTYGHFQPVVAKPKRQMPKTSLTVPPALAETPASSSQFSQPATSPVVTPPPAAQPKVQPTPPPAQPTTTPSSTNTPKENKPKTQPAEKPVRKRIPQPVLAD